MHPGPREKRTLSERIKRRASQAIVPPAKSGQTVGSLRRGRQKHLTLASLVPDEVLRALAIAVVLRLGVQQARGIHACDRTAQRDV